MARQSIGKMCFVPLTLVGVFGAAVGGDVMGDDIEEAREFHGKTQRKM